MEQAVQAAVQTAAVQTTGIGRFLGRAAGGQQMAGDGFAMIFQQLMGGEDGTLAALFAQMAGSAQDEAEDLGAQMAAEMLCMSPNMQSQMLFAMMQQTQQSGAAAESVTGAYTPAANGMQALAGLLGQQAEVFAGGNTEAESLMPQDFYTVLSTAWKSDIQPATRIDLQMGSAVMEAKQLLAGSKPEENIEALDVESLQAQVDAKTFIPEAMLEKQEVALPSAEEIAKQLKSGILENVQQGKNEFVVKLKPEGIGEIVVKLSENHDKISLSIFTSSSDTAKLISSEVMALQNALKPLNAEVEQIQVNPSGSAAEYMAQSSMTDQNRQFSGQQFFEQQRQSYYAQHQEDGFDGSVAQILAEEGLDTYI